MEHKEHLRLVTYRQEFQQVTSKLHRIVRSFIAEGGEREDTIDKDEEAKASAAVNNKWNNFRKAQLDGEIAEFIEAGPRPVTDEDIEARAKRKAYGDQPAPQKAYFTSELRRKLAEAEDTDSEKAR